MNTPTIRRNVNRDDYGRRTEHFEVNGTAVAVVVTLPNTTERRANNEPTHFVNDYTRSAEDVLYFHSIADARVEAAFRAGLAADQFPAEDETPTDVPSLGTLEGSLDDDLIEEGIEKGILVAHEDDFGTYYEVFAGTEHLTCTEECGGCVNGELCAAVAERAITGDLGIKAYGIPSVQTCGHGGECAALANR